MPGATSSSTTYGTTAGLRIGPAGANSSTGSINLNTGFGGSLTVGAPIIQPGFGSIVAWSGSVNIHADFMNIEGDPMLRRERRGLHPIVRTTDQPGRAQSGPRSLNALELIPEEVNLITTPNLLLGGPLTGDVNIVSSLGDFDLPNLTVQSGADSTSGTSSWCRGTA